MKHITITFVAASFAALSSAQSLYNNAVNAGLVQEGLRTDARPQGGSYSQVQPGNMLAGFRGSVTGSATDRLADDFSVPQPGWIVTGATFYMYQTDATSLSITGGLFEIHKKTVLGGVGAKVASGTMTGDYWTDIYRIFTNRPDDTRRIQKLKVSFDVVLQAGEYFLVWAAVGTQPYTGPWQPYLTKTGAQSVPEANALQSANAGLTWFFVEDGLRHQDFPFMISGRENMSGNWGDPLSPPSQ